MQNLLLSFQPFSCMSDLKHATEISFAETFAYSALSAWHVEFMIDTLLDGFDSSTC